MIAEREEGGAHQRLLAMVNDLDVDPQVDLATGSDRGGSRAIRWE
jgi:hypothetical protein